jgi:hypothetical protein
VPVLELCWLGGGAARIRHELANAAVLNTTDPSLPPRTVLHSLISTDPFRPRVSRFASCRDLAPVVIALTAWGDLVAIARPRTLASLTRCDHESSRPRLALTDT